MQKTLSILRRVSATLLAIAIFAMQLPASEAAQLSIGSDTLATSTAGATSAHTISFSTQSDLVTGDTIELSFPDFSFSLSSTGDIIVPVGPTNTVAYSNPDKKITLTLTEDFAAGAIQVAIADGGITNPATEGQYGIRISTFNSGGTVLDYGIATAEVDNNVQLEVNILPVVANVTSPNADGSYPPGETISIEVVFTGNVYVTGIPTLSLNNGGTASYASGSGTNTLTFNYEILSTEVSENELDYDSTTALTLTGGATITLANSKSANLILATPGDPGSLGYNKDIMVQNSNFLLSVSAPIASSFEIVDDNGLTSDPTPVMKFSGDDEAARVAFSCDSGSTWSNWIDYPGNSEVNTDNSEDFNILSCGEEEGLKVIWMKFANSFGYESEILTDSTIYQDITVEVTKVEDTTETVTEVVDVEVDISEELDTTTDEDSEEAKIIEVGYVDPNHKFWKSFRDIEIDDESKTISVDIDESLKDDIEIRVIEAKRLEKQEAEIKTTQPVLPKTGGEIPFELELVSETSTATVEIAAETSVSSNGGSSYNRVIYAPEVIETPPPISDASLELDDAIFVGSSSGSISFDKPVLLTLPVEDKKEPQICHFDEELNEWFPTVDIISGKPGGELSFDGETISVWVDHMTLFAVVGVKEVKLVGIKQIAIGGGDERRAEFDSGEWFSPADIGNDDLISFAWSGIGDKFYYTIDKNPIANSLIRIQDSTPFTNDFFLDDIRVSEGESYFHIRAEGANGERNDEKVFVINYDKTPPRLVEIAKEEQKIELRFSEEITTNDILTIYFADGQILEIPPLDSPVAKIEIAFEDEIAEIVSIVGLFVDRAGLIAINPEPLTRESIDGKIRDAYVEVLYPTQLINGKYITKKAFTNLIPHATGADQIRVNDEEWQAFSEKEFRIMIENFGAEKIIFDLENTSGDQKSTGVVITRIPSSADEVAEIIAAEDLSLESIRAVISARLKQLLVWGILSENEEMLSGANPAVLPSGDVPTNEEIKNLNQALSLAREIRELANRDEPAVRKIENLAEELMAKNFTLDDFLTLTEIDNLFVKISSNDAQRLWKFLDLNSVAVQKSGENFRVGELSLGMRDSDNDGLSDALELEIGSNPFLADSDGDGNLDGAEFLRIGSNVVESDPPQIIGFSNLGKKIASPQPFLTGFADANSSIEIIAKDSEGTEISLGKARTDTHGNFHILARAALPAGSYEFEIRDETQTLATQAVEINLDFILSPPKIFVGESDVFTEDQPAFFGNTFYGARVIAFFDDRATAVVVDNTLGDFVIRPPASLPVGQHTLTIFIELPDGTRSPARFIEFETADPAPKPAAHKAEILDRQKIALIGGSLFVAGILGILIFRRRRQTAP